MESAWPPHGNSSVQKGLLELCYGMGAEMEDGGRQGCVGLACGKNLDEVLDISCSSGGDYRDRDLSGYRGRQFTIEAGAGSIAVHGGQQYLSRAPSFRFACPFESLPSSRLASARHPNFSGRDFIRVAPGINGHNHSLRAKAGGDLADQSGIGK